jgi:hypothetical protein
MSAWSQAPGETMALLGQCLFSPELFCGMIEDQIGIRESIRESMPDRCDDCSDLRYGLY